MLLNYIFIFLFLCFVKKKINNIFKNSIFGTPGSIQIPNYHYLLFFKLLFSSNSNYKKKNITRD